MMVNLGLAKPPTCKGRETLQTCATSKDLPPKCFLRDSLEMCSTKAKKESKKEKDMQY